MKFILGNHTFAAISGNEDYLLLKNGLAPTLDQVDHLFDNTMLSINEREINLSFVLGGDYKVCQVFINYNSTYT